MTGQPMHPEAADLIEVATGAADDAHRERVRGHAAGCPRCQGLLEGLVAAFVAVRPSVDDSARMSERLLSALGDAPQRAAHLDDADLARLAAGEEAAAHEAAHLGACARCAAAFEALAQTRSFVLQAWEPSAAESARMTASFLSALDAVPAGAQQGTIERPELQDEAIVAYVASIAGTDTLATDASARMAARFATALANEAPAPRTHLDPAVLVAVAAGEGTTWTMRAHLDACPSCATGLHALRQATSIARGLVSEPSPFVSARIERNIARALDGDVREKRGRRSAWRPAQVAAAMACAAVVGAGFAVTTRTGGAPSAPVVATVADLTAEVARGDALASEGRRGDAVVAWAAALAGDDVVAGARIAALLKASGDEAAAPLLDVVDTHLASATAPEAMRVRCDLLLRWRSDETAVKACQGFVQAHPAHPTRGALEHAMGRLAAQRLATAPTPTGLHDARAQLLAQTTGLSSPTALLDRARCRSDLGDTDLARADLRVVLLVDPLLARRADVASLARALDVPLP